MARHDKPQAITSAIWCRINSKNMQRRFKLLFRHCSAMTKNMLRLLTFICSDVLQLKMNSMWPYRNSLEQWSHYDFSKYLESPAGPVKKQEMLNKIMRGNNSTKNEWFISISCAWVPLKYCNEKKNRRSFICKYVIPSTSGIFPRKWSTI